MALVARPGVRPVLAGIVVLVSLVVVPLAAQRQAPGGGTTALSAFEIDDLQLMREEEKLARDVYLVLHQRWGAQVFANIAESEQRHTDTIQEKLEKYGIADPVVDEDALGGFVNAFLLEKYGELVEWGDESAVDALKVGAFIEELDILDLQHSIERSTHGDLDTAYGKLMEGSASHLRAFVANLAAEGVTYEPVLLTREAFDAIIAGLCFSPLTA